MYADSRYRRAGMILSRYAGTVPQAFNDPAKGYYLEMDMFAQGAEVIFHASGGTGDGLFKAAQEAHRTAIGVDSDQGLIFQSASDPKSRKRGQSILSSMIKCVDIAVTFSAKRFLDGNRHLDGGYWSLGLKEDALGYALNEYNKDGSSRLPRR